MSAQRSSATGRSGFVSAPAQGAMYDALGTVTTLRARAADTSGTCEVIESVFPPGSQVPPHLHRLTDEIVYVLDGRIGIQVGQHTVMASPGTLVVLPRGTVHAFSNTRELACRVLVLAIPRFGPGVEELLETVSGSSTTPPSAVELAAILRTFDIEPVGPAS